MDYQIQYREATKSDIHQVAELHNKLAYFIREQTKDDYWNFEELSLDDTNIYLHEFLDSSKCKIIIAVNDSKIVGFIMGEVIKCHLPIYKLMK